MCRRPSLIGAGLSVLRADFSMMRAGLSVVRAGLSRTHAGLSRTRAPLFLALLSCFGIAAACGPETGRQRWVEVELPDCGATAAAAGANAEVTGPVGTNDAGITFALQEDAFDHPDPPPWAPFDVLAADMERDGDADVLVNFHNRARLELYENDGGRFRLRNPADGDRSGLFENPGIASLYATVPEMTERIREAAVSGVFLWHDPDRAGDWHVVVVPDRGDVSVRLRGNRPLRPLGLADRHFTRTDEFEVRVDVSERVAFRVDVEFVATGLEVDASGPLHVGPGLHRIEGGATTLWKDDPHGMAWVDVRGGPGREIFITRGGLMGTLQPPHAPKVDRFYEYRGEQTREEQTRGEQARGEQARGERTRGGQAREEETLYIDARRSIPGDYGRGRRVEWVDVDGDLVAELYIGNTRTPNSLLVADGERYRDAAAELGLDFEGGDVFTWLDVDEDGLDDLVFVGEDGFRVAYNRGGDRGFDVRPGAGIGLVLPSTPADDEDRLFASLFLYALDYDADGRLDLWLGGHGPELGHALFRKEDGGFSDVTSDVGLDNVQGTISLIVLDLENDGYPDALATGETFRLLRNEGGGRFRAETVGAGWGLPGFSRGAASDFDLDCRTDLVLVGDRRVLARNTTGDVGRVLQVMPRSVHGDPVGTLVRVVYSNGSVQAQRLGSAGSTQYSQGVAPLRFGIPADTSVDRLEVRWPDGRSETITTFDDEPDTRR